MTQYSEPELWYPVLAMLELADAGLTTTEIRKRLTEDFRPDGADAKILANRNDSSFSQKVRNLTGSHRKLEQAGLVTQDGPRKPWRITAAGRRYLAEGRRTGAWQGNVTAVVTETTAHEGRSSGLAAYRRANETPATAAREPFAIDPNEVDRALAAHSATQNALAEWLEANGIVPLRQGGGGADFDLAWEWQGWLYVAEVKSVSESNETKQLRLGLGQVLHYQAQLEDDGWQVRAVLVAERVPTDERWIALTNRHDVSLVWPGSFDWLLTEPTDTSDASQAVAP